MTIDSRTSTTDATGGVTAVAGRGRAATRCVDIAALLTPLLVFAVPSALVRAGMINDGFLLLNLCSLLVSALVAVYGHMCWHARPADGDLLCARTLTGPRTLDLTRLTKVGRLEVPGQTRTDDRLILTDAHGVRLVVHKLRGGDGTVDNLVRRALTRRPPGAGVVVSDRAAERLGLRAEVARPHGRLCPGRKIREGLVAWLPLLSVLVLTPVSIGLLLLALTLSGAL
ncbi:hypothetical protein [Streptomyces alfalfae]